MYIWK